MNLKTYLELKEKIEREYRAQKDALELLWKAHGVKAGQTPKEPVEPPKDVDVKRGGIVPPIPGKSKIDFLNPDEYYEERFLQKASEVFGTPPPHPDDDNDDYPF